MNQKHKTFYFILVIIVTLSAFDRVQLSKGSWKKIDKAIAKVWEINAAQKDQLNWSDLSLSKILLNGTETLYLVSNQDSTAVGYMIVSQAPSRYDNFDLMVLYDLDGGILKTDFLVYREDWGGEITSTRWLKQFEGKSAKDQIELNRGIQGISGATVSCRSAVVEINRLTQLMGELKSTGQLVSKN